MTAAVLQGAVAETVDAFKEPDPTGPVTPVAK